MGRSDRSVYHVTTISDRNIDEQSNKSEMLIFYLLQDTIQALNGSIIGRSKFPFLDVFKLKSINLQGCQF